MTYKGMIELVKKLQEEAKQCHDCDLVLYLLEEGELRTQLLKGSYTFCDGFADLITFGSGDTRDPRVLVDSLEPIDGFPRMKEWYWAGY